MTRRARFALPIGGRGDAGRADRALTPLSRPFCFYPLFLVRPRLGKQEVNEGGNGGH